MKNIQRTILATLLLVASAAFAADGIAFITNLKGEVAIDGNQRPVLLSEVAKGQKISVGKESLVSVMYIASGKEYVLRGPADYVVRDNEVAGSTAMPPVTRDTAWRTTNKVLVQVAQTSAASVRMRSIAVAKPDVDPKLLFPTQGTVANLQPTFRWRAADSKAPAEVTLLIAGQEKPVLLAKAAGGAYRVPAKLLPETEYLWTVKYGGDEIGTGKFRTAYPNGSAIDPSTDLMGVKFSGIEGAMGEPGVADIVTQNPKFATCITQKMLTYGLGRLLTDTDNPYLDLVNSAWLKDPTKASIGSLVHGLVSTETFRSRRGGT